MASREGLSREAMEDGEPWHRTRGRGGGRMKGATYRSSMYVVFGRTTNTHGLSCFKPCSQA